MKTKIVTLLLVGMFSQTAVAGVCDYRPSKLIGGGTTAAVAGGSGAAKCGRAAHS